MARRRSLLDVKRPPRPKVAMVQMANGRWKVGIMFPGAVEPLIFDRPTKLGAENEAIHQCRKRKHIGYGAWDEMERIWGKSLTEGGS